MCLVFYVCVYVLFSLPFFSFFFFLFIIIIFFIYISIYFFIIIIIFYFFYYFFFIFFIFIIIFFSFALNECVKSVKMYTITSYFYSQVLQDEVYAFFVCMVVVFIIAMSIPGLTKWSYSAGECVDASPVYNCFDVNVLFLPECALLDLDSYESF